MFAITDAWHIWIWIAVLLSYGNCDNEINERTPLPVQVGADVIATTAESQATKELLATEPLLFISTLDGTLHAVSKRTGLVKWKLDENPVLHVPPDAATTIKGPTFLPDPHDGSLYAFDPSSKALTKLPFTIPELVQASPCRSSDGILYTGRKRDVWYAINPDTGDKEQVITTDASEEKCPGGDVKQMFIGRSEYKVTMFDTKLNMIRWNVTFTDYSSHANEKVSNDYNLLHLASSADGFVITVDRQTGRIIWAQNYGYPVVAMYAWVPEGLQRVQMTSVAKETLTYLLQQADGKVSYWDILLQGNPRFQPKQDTLMPSLYVGQYQHSLYALPAMTHHGITVDVIRGGYMLPGPDDKENNLSTELDVLSDTVPMPTWRLIGYHKIPPNSKINFPPVYKRALKILQIEQQTNDEPNYGKSAMDNIIEENKVPPFYQPPISPIKQTQAEKQSYKKTRPHYYKQPTQSHETKIKPQPARWHEITLVAVLTSILTGALFLLLFKRSHITSHSDNGPTKYDGLIRVGQISIDPVDIIGRGSEGTVVYKGSYDGRKVAVKRVMPESFSFADREVQLLRESDEHSHVVRYFCMERDTQFQYIALELCSNTLQEYVENPHYRCGTDLDIHTVLHQAMLGLDHLHKLKIVHRDVKPSNLLISNPGKLGKQRVVISDFGLCKKLNPGKISFSHRSGMAGTDGWIAPEMVLDKKYRMTQAVDIFSMGCVFYYVISGKHPFGDSISRQARIVNGEYSLNEIQSYEHAEEAMDLIRRMLVVDPSFRPKSDVILHHPLFWDAAKKLQFFEDVSDRIEKEPLDSPTMIQLDRDYLEDIQRGIPRDWILHLCLPLQDDLQKFRTYKAGSVRDLLRAIRNKKHHYRELPDNVKRSLGGVPDEFLHYFTSRFPRLLIHTFLAMSCCKQEASLLPYYGKGSQDYNYDENVNGLTGHSIFNKPPCPKQTWKNGRNSHAEYSPLRNNIRNNSFKYSAADQDCDWRSPKINSSSSNESFKSLSSRPPFQQNGIRMNGFSRNNVEDLGAGSPEDSEFSIVKSQKQLRKRLRVQDQVMRVSESSSIGSDPDGDRRSSRNSSFSGSYADAVTKSNPTSSPLVTSTLNSNQNNDVSNYNKFEILNDEDSRVSDSDESVNSTAGSNEEIIVKINGNTVSEDGEEFDEKTEFSCNGNASDHETQDDPVCETSHEIHESQSDGLREASYNELHETHHDIVLESSHDLVKEITETHDIKNKLKEIQNQNNNGKEKEISDSASPNKKAKPKRRRRLKKNKNKSANEPLGGGEEVDNDDILN